MWPPESSGSWADWVSGIATAGALIFALVQLGIERTSIRRAGLSAQARKVNAWFVPDVDTPVEFKDDKGMTYSFMPGTTDFVYIRNDSENVIYDVVVTTIVAQTPRPLKKGIDSVLRIVPPGSHRVPITKVVIGDKATGAVSISFRDIDGRNWTRDHHGKLTRYEESALTRLLIKQPISYASLHSDF